MKKRIFNMLIVSVLMITFSDMLGQESEPCRADQFFEQYDVCNVKNHGIKCLELDISGSLDEKGKEYEYRWSMGDGNTYKGLNVNHCYEQYGSYFVSLDLVEVETNFVIQNELSEKIVLWPPMDIEYDVDTIRVNAANFEYETNYLPDVTVNNIFWKIEDKKYCGKRLRHVFKEKGLHVVEIGVIGISEEKEDLVGCTLRGVYITSVKL